MQPLTDFPGEGFMQDFLIPLVSIFAAEFGDKTMLAVLLLGSKTRHPLMLVLGAMFAFLIVDGSAVLFGAWSGKAFPMLWIKLLSAGLFLFLGVKMLLEKSDDDEAEAKHHDKHPLLAGFLVIFFAEWGDKTQIASALFGARYQPGLVLAGAMTALFLISAAAAFLGQWIGHRLQPGLIQKAAGGIFILMAGLTLIF